MHLDHQEAYEWPVSVYLFFGGLGGALMALSYIFHFFTATAPLIGITVISALVLFALAGAFLVLFDLERPFNAVYSLNNFTKSGISWDVILIGLNYVGGILYVLPEYTNIFGSAGQALAPYQLFFGAIAAIAGFLFPIISGGLLAGPASIPLWHTPALPILFLVTSFELALAYVGSMFSLQGIVNTVFAGGIFALSLLVFGISLAYLEHAHNGPVEAKEGMHHMLKTARFVVLYPLAGVLFPLVLSGYLLFGGTSGGWEMPAMAVALFIGGFAVRNCLVLNGIETYPWPY